jgi:uncharacterized membrane protein (UPF0136 family)
MGYQWAAGTSLIMAGAMTFRLIKTKKIVPAGILAPLAILSCGYYTQKLVGTE